MQPHWHVKSNPDEEDPFVDLNMYAAIDAAAEDLHFLADMHFQDITGLGESKLYESAYTAFKDWQAIETLKTSAENVVNQHNTTERNDRAPLFRNWHINQQSGDYGDHSKLAQTAHWVISKINADTNIEIYECRSDDIIGDEDNVWHETYNPSL